MPSPRPHLDHCWIVEADLYPPVLSMVPPGGTPVRFHYAIGGSALSVLREAAYQRMRPPLTVSMGEMGERDRLIAQANSLADSIAASLASAIVQAIGDEMMRHAGLPKTDLPPKPVGVDIASVDAQS